MNVQKIPFNEAADIVQDRFHEEGKPYSFAARRNPQPPRNNRTEGVQPRRPSSEDMPPSTLENTSPIKDQTQNKQTPILTRPIAQQEEPSIDLPNDHSTDTERQNKSQQSQDITETTNQTEVPKPSHQKKQPTSEKPNKPQGDEKEKETTKKKQPTSEKPNKPQGDEKEK